MLVESTIKVDIPVRCIGCSRLRTIQYNDLYAGYKCRDKVVPGQTCFRSTDYTD